MRPLAVLNIVGLSPSLLGADAPRLRDFARSSGGVRMLKPPLPAVTCTSQATMLTGLSPRDHGVVGNGWFHRDLQEIHFWKQSNRLVHGEKVWERARREFEGERVRCANLFWWFNMHSSADISVTPRPIYCADGRKVPDCLTHPPQLRDELQAKLGEFPLFRFWGPGADVRSTDWIAAAAMHTYERERPELTLIYLPHLDYPLQKLGPAHAEIRRHVREVDRVFAVLHDFFRERGVRVLVVSEYGIAPVTSAVEPNRLLRSAGLLAVRQELGREMLDVGESEAFAVCDHQLAHVYVKSSERVAEIATLLSSHPGIELALDRSGQRSMGIDHERSGEIVLVAKEGHWFAYPYWLAGREPDFARTVDIHRKPGYDPCELFIDPKIRFPKLAVAWRLMKRSIGMRTLLDVIPIDPSLVRGSHGRVQQPRGYEPVLFGDGLDSFDPPNHGPLLPMELVRDAILNAMRG
jgi:predicted AlkP superfamily pyrophosphatase or phosphodiesterase